MSVTNDEITNNDIWDKAKQYGIQQLESEYLRMVDMIPNGAKGIDIGCYSGGTTIGFSMICSKLASVDLNKSFDTAETEANCEHSFFTGDSRNPAIIQGVEDYFNGELVDFLFIDGDHSAYGAEQDYLNYKHLVRAGGMIFFHDIVDSDFHRMHGCMVSQAWERVRTNHKVWQELKEDEGQIWAGIGVLIVE
jgi:cephalosporin hydroxylase